MLKAFGRHHISHHRPKGGGQNANGFHDQEVMVVIMFKRSHRNFPSAYHHTPGRPG